MRVRVLTTRTGRRCRVSAIRLKGRRAMKALSHGQVEGKTRRRQSGVDLSSAPPRDHRAGAGAGRQASRGRDRRALSAQAARSCAVRWVSLRPKDLWSLRRNRGAAVATPAWEEARDTFDVRLGLERLVMSRLAGRLTTRADQYARSACGSGRARAGQQRAALDPSCDRIPYPARAK